MPAGGGPKARPLGALRLPVQDQRQLTSRASALIGERDLFTGLVGADRDDQPDLVGDPVAVHRDHDVAFPQPGPVGRGALGDLEDVSATISWLAVHVRADNGIGRLPGLEDLLSGDPHLAHRDREPDTDVAGFGATHSPVVAIAELTPTTWPRRFTKGPPELPGLMAASVWIALMKEYSSSLPAVTGRFKADTIPEVTVLVNPSGDPMATTPSPIRRSSEEPIEAGLSRLAFLTFNTARS